MQQITYRQIEQMFPRDIFEVGQKLYELERVQGLSFHKHERAWFAEVYEKEPYYVEIGMEKLAAGKLQLYCECPKYQMYRKCQHLVALLLKVADEKQMNVVEPEWADRFFQEVLQQAPAQEERFVFDKLPMQVEYIVRIDHNRKVWLQCKTGITHRYVIYHMRDFLHAVLNDEPFRFTKKFTYEPDKHFFVEEDHAIFIQLAEIIRTGDLFTDRYYDTQQAYDRREILIPPLLLQSLLKKLQTHNVTVTTDAKTYDRIEQIKEKLPARFRINYTDELRYTLSLQKESDEHFLREYDTIFANGTFYFPTEQQLKLYEQIHSLPFETDIPIQNEQVSTFFSEVVPSLKAMIKVQIDESIQQSFVERELEAELHVRFEETIMTGQLIYRYGNIEIDPFKRYEREDVVVIRDVQKERQIMHLIEQANFHYNGKHLYIDATDDALLYEFLYTVLPELKKHISVYVDEQIERMLLRDELKPVISVDVDMNTNLLEIDFDIAGIDEAEIAPLLESIVLKKRYYRSKAGQIFSLEKDTYEETRKLINDLQLQKQIKETRSFTVPTYRAIQIADHRQLQLKYSESFRALLKNVREPEKKEYALPEELQATLRPYQKVGYQWFKSLSACGLGGILADDMGLGKTVQTLAYLLSERSDKPHLVVAPSSVVYNWHNECRKFAPTLNVVVMTGEKEERRNKLFHSAEADIWITSYSTLRQDEYFYKNFSFHALILDEAQYVKNYKTKTSQAVRTIRAERRFALSGTPIENSLDELWAIFQVILPGFLPPKRQFKQLDEKVMTKMIRPFILRRLKSDVLTELPEKIESVHVSELSPEQKKLYVAHLQEIKKTAQVAIQTNTFQQNRMKLLAGLTRLRQICCHPSLFIENYTGTSQKLEELMSTVQAMLKDGRRLLIFSQFTSMHELIMKRLDELRIEYFYLHGKTDAKDRLMMTEAFNRGEKQLFLISLKAGGTGLNLTGADTVILYDLWWNPAVEDQATDRAHRIGQKNVVHVIRFIAEGTIEEKMYAIQQKKRQLIDRVIQPGTTLLNQLSEEEIRQLLDV